VFAWRKENRPGSKGALPVPLLLQQTRDKEVELLGHGEEDGGFAREPNDTRAAQRALWSPAGFAPLSLVFSNHT
jgi:hypothetical protein